MIGGSPSRGMARLLVDRVLFTTVTTTRSRQRAMESRFSWLDDGSGIYRLRVLGILNGLFGTVIHR